MKGLATFLIPYQLVFLVTGFDETFVYIEVFSIVMALYAAVEKKKLLFVRFKKLNGYASGGFDRLSGIFEDPPEDINVFIAQLFYFISLFLMILSMVLYIKEHNLIRKK